MKTVITIICLMIAHFSNAQIPIEPKNFPKKNTLPLPKIQPIDAIKPDLTVAVLQIDSVLYDKPSKTYKVLLQVTTANNSTSAIRVGTNATTQPKIQAYITYFDERLNASVVKAAQWDSNITSLSSDESVTEQKRFYFRGLPTNSITNAQLHLTIDYRNSVTEANEENNKSELIDILFDPSIIGVRNEHDHF